MGRKQIAWAAYVERRTGGSEGAKDGWPSALPYNIRKYTKVSPRSKYHQIGKLLIKPQKEKVTNFLRKIQEVLDNNKTAKQESIIRTLNPMLRGFSMYYRFVVSSKTFQTIDYQVWQKLWKWAVRRHPTKSKTWIMRKYFTTSGRKWVFVDEIGNRIKIMALTPIVRYTKIKKGMRIHADDKETREYWQKRIYTNALSQVYSIKVERLMKKRKGICPCCGNPITKDDIADQEVHAQKCRLRLHFSHVTTFKGRYWEAKQPNASPSGLSCTCTSGINSWWKKWRLSLHFWLTGCFIS